MKSRCFDCAYEICGVFLPYILITFMIQCLRTWKQTRELNNEIQCRNLSFSTKVVIV